MTGDIDRAGLRQNTVGKHDDRHNDLFIVTILLSGTIVLQLLLLLEPTQAPTDASANVMKQVLGRSVVVSEFQQVLLFLQSGRHGERPANAERPRPRPRPHPCPLIHDNKRTPVHLSASRLISSNLSSESGVNRMPCLPVVLRLLVAIERLLSYRMTSADDTSAHCCASVSNVSRSSLYL